MGRFLINLDNEGYKISDTDTAGVPAYFGYLLSSGKWYIVEENSTNGTYRYCAGRDGYEAAWAGRATLTYVLFSALEA